MRFDGGQTMSRSTMLVLFVIGISPFVAMLALAQETHTHSIAGAEPVVAWLFHQNTIVIALAGLLGGLAHSVMVPPKGMQELLANIFFAVVCSVMLIPAVVDWALKDVSISALMAGSFLSAMAAQRLVPLILRRFEGRIEKILIETETKTFIKTKEIQSVPGPLPVVPPETK